MRKRIFDMDGVFYPYTEEFHHGAAVAMAEAATKMGLQIPFEKAVAIARDSYARHQFSGHRFVQENGLNWAELSVAYHETVQVEIVIPDNDLLNKFRMAAEGLTQHQVILTQSTSNWANKLLSHLQIKNLFSSVICKDHCDYKLKVDSPVPFEIALAALGSEAHETDMIEDSLPNLIIPKDMGLRTIYIHHGKPLEKLPVYVDAQIAQPADAYKLDIMH